MNKTEKLYDLDAYKMEFEATVLSCEQREHGFAVILDRTNFFPEEGGQTPDQGFINNIPVVDVQIQDDIITHTLTEPVEAGSQVEGQVDFKERFSNMQQHSAEHILSGLIYKSYGYENVGFHLSPQTVTLDVGGPLTEEQIDEIFRAANRVVSENVEILARYPEEKELKEMYYRSKKELEGPIRIVSVGPYDCCACCAPHVARTGEIGCIQLTRWERYKGGVRLTILAGSRAVEDSIRKQKLLDKICQNLSTNQEELAETVDKLKKENQDLKYRILQIGQEKAKQLGDSIPAGSKPVILCQEDLDASAAKTLMNTLQEKCTGVIALFIGKEGAYRYMITAGEKGDARTIQEQLKQTYQVKGGGNAKMVQGTIVGEGLDPIHFLS